jgi:hypothetical protein
MDNLSEMWYNKKMFPIWIAHSEDRASTQGLSGLQMAEVIENKSFVLLCDWHCESDDMYQQAVTL